MIDVHNHILFGLDDGAKTVEDSINMLDMAYADGTRAMIATPHFHEAYVYTTVQMEENFKTLVTRYQALQPEMNLYLGNEAFLDEKLLTALKEGRCKTMAGTNYVLVELSYSAPMQLIKTMLIELMMNGYLPIIAHCERLVDDKDDLLDIEALKEMGCALQINGSALVKPQSHWLKKWLLQNLENGTISFVASDGHGIVHRKPVLGAAYKLVTKKLGKEIADAAFGNNAKRIIAGETLI